MKLPDIEEVSKKIHDQWMRTTGVESESRKSELGEELYVPYDELSDAAKDLDRNSVKMVYAAIKELNEAEKKCKCTTCKCDKALKENVESPSVSIVKLTSLFDNPVIQHELTESNNEIFVKSAHVMKDACGTGQIELLGRSILLNVCESDNVIKAEFDLEVDGKTYFKVPFVVRLTEGNQFLKLNKNNL